METKVLIQTFTEFAKQKNVDRPTMIRILQDVFRAMIKKRFGKNYDVEVRRTFYPNWEKEDRISAILYIIILGISTS